MGTKQGKKGDELKAPSDVMCLCVYVKGLNLSLIISNGINTPVFVEHFGPDR